MPTANQTEDKTMDNYSAQLADQLAASILMPIFEIEVTNSDGDTDWISCDIFIQDNSLVAERDSVSSKEEKSGFIASTKVAIDACFSLDEHIQALYEDVIRDIIAGDLFDLAE